jgi:hypothetical protein
MFGTSIDRGMEKYPPTTLETVLKYGILKYAPLVHLKHHAANLYLSPEHRGNCFRVPDESDGEGMSSDDDQVQNSCKMLYAKSVRPAVFQKSSSSRSPIDLTCEEDQSVLSNLRVDVPFVPPSTQPSQLSPLLSLTRHEESPQPISNDASTPSDNNGFAWSDEEDEDAERVDDDGDDGEDEEMGEDSHVASAIADADDDNPVLRWESSPVSDMDGNQDSVSTDNEFDEHDEFEGEEGTLAMFNDMAHFDHFSDDLDLNDSTIPRNDDTRATGDSPAQVSSAEPDTPKQQKMNVIEEPTPKVPSQPELSDTVEMNKAQFARVNDHWCFSLPPVAAPPMQSFSLPSISELTPKPSILGPNWAAAAAETMGRKTGKAEYFAAREVNKVNARVHLPSFRHPCLDHTQSTLPSQMQPPNITEQLTQPRQVVPPFSDLTDSGVRFLNTPHVPFHQVEPETVNAESVLDETSAFSFEQSKKASAIAEPVTDTLSHAAVSQEIDFEETHTLTEAAPTLISTEIIKDESAKGTKESSETPKSSKRKAEEISELITEEELMESGEPLTPQQATCRPPKRAAGYLHRETRAAVAPPPPKRLRRMAEVVGYATLGGVAVMSALIATAPTL